MDDTQIERAAQPPMGRREPDRSQLPAGRWWERLRLWADMIFLDHGFFRMVYLNLHRISPKAWRAAQPTPYQIRRLARRGVRSVVNLRGGRNYGSLPLEIAACDAAGVAFHQFILRSRGLPGPAEIAAARAFFDEIAYPVLFHCKSGADRAGMMSALYLILHENVPVAEARRQLSLRYGHIRQGKTGVLDALFDAYEADQPDAAIGFWEWSQTRYDPAAVTAKFKATPLGQLLSDTLLRRE